MSEQEIKNFLSKKEVIDYLKKNLELYLNVEPCIGVCGYDIEATVSLHGEELAKDTDCI